MNHDNCIDLDIYEADTLDLKDEIVELKRDMSDIDRSVRDGYTEVEEAQGFLKEAISNLSGALL